MNVLFVNYHDFSSNSAIHIFNIANVLVEIGVDCGVCVPRNKHTIELIGKAKFEVYNFSDFHKKRIRFHNGSPPDIIHAWTPREIVREFTQQVVNHYGCKYIVHLEDNEEEILKATFNIEPEKWGFIPNKIVDRIIPKHLSHPIKYVEFLEKSDGVTVIIDKLFDFKPEPILGKVIWPGFENEFLMHQSIYRNLKAELGISEYSFIVVYSGNVHHSNKKEVYGLYLAIAALNRKGIPIILVRTGQDFVDLYDDTLRNCWNCFIELGFVERRLLPEIMSLSDVFVQPGKSDEFNDYRFPSKLPEFLVMGKPVILPNTNIGRYLEDGYNGILLKKGHALEICEKLEYVYNHLEECSVIGEKGREFALKNFRWSVNTQLLYDFYIKILN